MFFCPRGRGVVRSRASRCSAQTSHDLQHETHVFNYSDSFWSLISSSAKHKNVSSLSTKTNVCKTYFDFVTLMVLCATCDLWPGGYYRSLSCTVTATQLYMDDNIVSVNVDEVTLFTASSQTQILKTTSLSVWSDYIWQIFVYRPLKLYEAEKINQMIKNKFSETFSVVSFAVISF